LFLPLTMTNGPRPQKRRIVRSSAQEADGTDHMLSATKPRFARLKQIRRSRLSSIPQTLIPVRMEE
jgi:hypothetical protein